MPTETFVSCAKAGEAETTKTSAANENALTIHDDLGTEPRSSIPAAFKLVRLPFSGAAHRLYVSTFEFHLAEVFLRCC